jgi:hypothetical protein
MAKTYLDGRPHSPMGARGHTPRPCRPPGATRLLVWLAVHDERHPLGTSFVVAAVVLAVMVFVLYGVYLFVA